MLIPFNLEHLPLFQAYLIQISETEFDFALFMPHIIVDGGCADIFYKELKHYYFSDEALPPLPAHYIDHVFWEREILAVNSREKHQFWEQYIGNQGVFRIPARMQTSVAQMNAGNLHSFLIPEFLNQEFALFCRAHKLHVEQGYLLLLRLMLYGLSKQQTLFIPYLRHGRYDSRLNEVIGNFITIDVYQLDVDERWTWNEYVAAFNQALLGAAPYQDANFISKFFPLMKQTFLFRKTAQLLSPVLRPFLSFYLKRHQIDPTVIDMISTFAVEDCCASLLKALKKNRKPLDTSIVLFNVLPTYYQNQAYQFDAIQIKEHSYLETMNINLGEDSLFFYFPGSWLLFLHQ